MRLAWQRTFNHNLLQAGKSWKFARSSIALGYAIGARAREHSTRQDLGNKTPTLHVLLR
jgi:hypothetical protein